VNQTTLRAVNLAVSLSLMAWGFADLAGWIDGHRWAMFPILAGFWLIFSAMKRRTAEGGKK
jgi:hypothetical protein